MSGLNDYLVRSAAAITATAERDLTNEMERAVSAVVSALSSEVSSLGPFSSRGKRSPPGADALSLGSSTGTSTLTGASGSSEKDERSGSSWS